MNSYDTFANVVSTDTFSDKKSLAQRTSPYSKHFFPKLLPPSLHTNLNAFPSYEHTTLSQLSAPSNPSYGGGHWGVPSIAIPQKISINTVIPQKKSANIAIPHRKSKKYRNRKNVVYYSHYALQLTRIAWFRI